MNPELKKLYQATLLQHSKQPRNAHPIDGCPQVTSRNPLCGDEVTVYLDFQDNAIQALAFTAQACSICTASASMMTERLQRLAPDDAAAFARDLVSRFAAKPPTLSLEGELAALEGVLAFPSRIRCATLPWEAALQLLPPPSPRT